MENIICFIKLRIIQIRNVKCQIKTKIRYMWEECKNNRLHVIWNHETNLKIHMSAKKINVIY